MDRLSTLRLPLCAPAESHDPSGAPPTAEDACRQSLQPTCCQNEHPTIPLCSRADNLRCRGPRRRSCAPATTPKRRVELCRVGEAPAPAETNTDLECRALDGARANCSPSGQAPEVLLRRAARCAPTTGGIVHPLSCCTSGTAGVACHPRDAPPADAGKPRERQGPPPPRASTRTGPTTRNTFHRLKPIVGPPPKRVPADRLSTRPPPKRPPRQPSPIRASRALDLDCLAGCSPEQPWPDDALRLLQLVGTSSTT
jgi:hypothetical protein